MQEVLLLSSYPPRHGNMRNVSKSDGRESPHLSRKICFILFFVTYAIGLFVKCATTYLCVSSGDSCGHEVSGEIRKEGFLIICSILQRISFRETRFQ
jgi:hypothetical protein